MVTVTELYRLKLSMGADETLIVRLDSPGGSILGERTIPWTGYEQWYGLSSERETVEAQLSAGGGGGADGESGGGMDPVAAIGRLLYDSVIGAELGEALRIAISRSPEILLQIECPAEDLRLLGVPWQLLHDGERYLAHAGVAIGARVPSGPALFPGVDGPLRVLVVFASPRSAEVPPVSTELRAIERLYADIPAGVHVTELAYGITPEDIEQAWNSTGGFHIVHFLCPSTDDTLLLEGEGGASVSLLWERLVPTIAAYPRPWLVTLGTGRWPRDPWRLAFDRARDGALEKSGIFSSVGRPLDWTAVAQSFAKMGVPAVLTYQLPIDGHVARLFTERFCHAALSSRVSIGDAWRLAAEACTQAFGSSGSPPPPPALVGDVALPLPQLPAGPTVLPTRARRPGVDLGLFSETPPAETFAGRYHLSSQFLRQVLIGRDHSALVLGPPGVGKTAFVGHQLGLVADVIHAVRRISMRKDVSVESIYSGVAEFCTENGWDLPDPAWEIEGPIDDPTARARAYGQPIVTALAGKRALIVLDELDRAMEPGSLTWRFRDPGIGRLLALLAEELNGSGVWMLSTQRPDFGTGTHPRRLATFSLREPQPRTARELFERWPELAKLDLETQRSMYQATRGLPGVVGSLALLARHGGLHGLLADLVPRRLHSDSEDAYRASMCRTVYSAALQAFPKDVRRLVVFVALSEAPQRTLVADQLGFEVAEETVEELAGAGLIEVLRLRDRSRRRSDRGPAYLWTNEIVRSVALDLAPSLGIREDQLRERLGAFHALNAIEKARVEHVPGISKNERAALRTRRRMDLLRAYDYFVRARRWTGAVEVAVRAVDLLWYGPQRAELRRMLGALAACTELTPIDTVSVLTSLASLEESDGHDDRVIPLYRRAREAARAARRQDLEAEVLLRLARFQLDHGDETEAGDSAGVALSIAERVGDHERLARAKALEEEMAS